MLSVTDLVWELLQVASHVFRNCLHYMLSISLLSGIRKQSRLHLKLSVLQLWSQPNLQEALVPSRPVVVGNQLLGVSLLVAASVAFRLFQGHWEKLRFLVVQFNV